jgi:predicted MFS family arabinose efflux permease
LLGGYLSRYGYGVGFGAGLACAVVGLAAGQFLSPSLAIEDSRGYWRALVIAYTRLVRVITQRPAVLLGMSFVLLNSFLLQVMGGSFFLVYTSTIGLAAFQASLLVSGRELIGTLLRPGFGIVSRRVPPVLLLSAGTLLATLALTLTPLASSFVGLGLIAIGAGLGTAFLPAALHILSGVSVAPEEQSYGIASLNLTAWSSQTLTAPLAGVVLSAVGYQRAYPIFGALCIGAALLVLRWGSRIMRSTSTHVESSGGH